VSPEIRQWQDELSSELGTKVAIQSNNGKGSIVVPFHSEEELARIIELIVK
jgi:hypothetical protein